MDAAALVSRIRALNGITRQDLSALAGLSPSTIGRIEKGTLDPTWGTLSKILDSTGYRIHGESIASAGDTAAITSAYPILTQLLAGRAVTADAVTADEWVCRWDRAGWLVPRRALTLAVAAGNAAKITRRDTPHTTVAAPRGWQALAHSLSAADIDYAVSGLAAARGDRVSAPSTRALIYVPDPEHVTQELRLETAPPGEGVLLLTAHPGDLRDVQTEDELRFVPTARALLDAFAGAGRDPDKAEARLRGLLEEAA